MWAYSTCRPSWKGLLGILGDLVSILDDLVSILGDLVSILGDLVSILGDLVSILDGLGSIPRRSFLAASSAKDLGSNCTVQRSWQLPLSQACLTAILEPGG